MCLDNQVLEDLVSQGSLAMEGLVPLDSLVVEELVFLGNPVMEELVPLVNQGQEPLPPCVWVSLAQSPAPRSWLRPTGRPPWRRTKVCPATLGEPLLVMLLRAPWMELLKEWTTTLRIVWRPAQT